jgi:hypothetical protein
MKIVFYGVCYTKMSIIYDKLHCNIFSLFDQFIYKKRKNVLLRNTLIIHRILSCHIYVEDDVLCTSVNKDMFCSI